MDICFKKIQQEYAEMGAIHGLSFTKSWSQSTFRDMFEDNVHYSGSLILLEKTIIGFIICSKIVDEAEIITICISPEHRGKGYASQLLQHEMTHLRQIEIKKLFLEVNEFNLEAIKLYQKLQFQQVALRKNYYKTNDGKTANALVLALNL